MKYQTEIFDQVQYLFHKTGFNDHQLHCVIRFKNKIQADIMEKSVIALTKVIPILTRTYKNLGGKSYWEDSSEREKKDLFKIVDNEKDFYNFTCSKTKEDSGLQIRVCLLSSDKDAISIILNHMVTDGAGMKQCVYLLSELYSKILKQPDYMPDYCIDGDRSFTKVISGIRLKDRLRILLFKNKDNNQEGNYVFPMSKDKNISPFILTRELSPKRYDQIQKYCKEHNVTVNDYLLTAYFRVLSRMLDIRGQKFSIPIMIDMRKYLEDKSINAFSNLSSTAIVSVVINPDEEFSQTLTNINSEMSLKKKDNLGINTFLKLDTLYRILGSKIAYNLLNKTLKNPDICMTNIGLVDSQLLKFEGSTIENVYICGAIKYRPHFQVAVTSFHNTMTLCVNLYGSRDDQDNYNKFLDLMDKEMLGALGNY